MRLKIEWKLKNFQGREIFGRLKTFQSISTPRSDWIMTTFWLHFDCILPAFHLNFECILTAIWLYFSCILAEFWMDFDFILTEFWMHFGWILTDFWLHFDCISTAFWLRFDCITTAFRLYFDRISNAFWLHYYCISAEFWLTDSTELSRNGWKRQRNDQEIEEIAEKWPKITGFGTQYQYTFSLVCKCLHVRYMKNFFEDLLLFPLRIPS